MPNRIYSSITEIPSGRAGEQLVDCCLVLEGGAFRGVYTAGILDAMMLQDLNMKAVIGCSAGALNGLNYMAGQIGRTGRINLGHRHDGQYVGPGPLRRERSLISFDFLFRQTDEFDPLDRARFFDSRRRFAVVVSDCLHGEARYPERDSCDNIYRAIQASASMPYVSPMVEVDGVPCLDGGCCCKIPYQWALDQGYEKIVIVRTRHPSYRKKPARPSQRRIAEKVYRSYPAFAEKLISSNEDYNRQCDEIEELARDGRVFVLSPSSPMEIHRLEGDMEKLGALYWMGYNDLMSHLATLKAYLGLG